MWYRIEWSDLYISDFGASQIKTVENCTNPGGPLEVGTKVKVYRPSEKKYWRGEIIRISACKADLDKVASSDQPQTGVAELEIDFMACHFKVTRSYVNQIIGNKIRELHRDRRMDLR